MMLLQAAAEGYGDDAVVLCCRLDEDTPWRRSRTGNTWADEVRRFFDVALEIAHEHGGRVGGVGHDGLSVWFAAHRAGSAINCAIDLHERLHDRHANPHLQHLSLRSGLGCGRAFLSMSSEGARLLIGPALERASHLAGYAPKWSVLVDTVALQEDAALDQVRSTAGETSQRHGAEYLGPVMQLRQDEHRVPISFHQILWAKQLFETKGAPSQTLGGPKDRLRGRVERWESARGHGFIRSSGGEWFYTDSRYTIDGLQLDVGEEVFFVARPALQPGKNQVAAAVLALGHSAEGQVVSMPSAQPFGFIAVRDSMDSEQHVLMRDDDTNVWPIAVGTDVGFVVGENAQGATATFAAPLGEFAERRDDHATVSVRSLLDGFDRALARLDERQQVSDPDFGPLFETLNWAVALDERIATQWAPRGRPLGMAWRSEVDGAELLGVLRLLRNRLAHQWSDALSLHANAGKPERHAEWRWRPLIDIKPGRVDPAAEATYQQRFEGRPVSEALHQVRKPLSFVVELLEPELASGP
jgi:class 3 adenylate cyclase